MPKNLIVRDIKGAIEREISPLKRKEEVEAVQIEDEFLTQKRIAVKELIQNTKESLLNNQSKQAVAKKNF